MPKLNPAAPIQPMGGMQPGANAKNQIYRIFGEQPANMPNPVSQQPTKPIAPMNPVMPQKPQGPVEDGMLNRYTRNWHIQPVPNTLKTAGLERLSKMTQLLQRIAAR